MDPVTHVKFNALLNPEGALIHTWGMTETTCFGTWLYWPESDTTGSVGRLVPGLEAKLLDENGQEHRKYDTRGEMLIRGPSIIDSYFDNPAANAASFRDGWLCTGDIMYCDGKTKKWYIVDRKKELIKVRGFQVAPPELEAVLLSHPLIVDAAVIGVPIGQGDETPRAYVVRRPGAEGLTLTESEVRTYASERLAKYKRVDGGVVFVDSLPKTASGKYLKKQLRDRAKKEMKTTRL